MSWKKYRLGDICHIEKGKIGIQKAIPGQFPLVVTAEERLSCNEYHFEGNAVIIPLVSSTGHGHKSLKRIHFQSGKFAVGNILCAVLPKDESFLRADFLYRFLDLNKEKELVSRMKGMANVTLPLKEIANIEIPVPPIEDQISFVQQYNLLEEKSFELNEEITGQLSLVKQLRQAFLREALQGKLVPQDPSNEPASVLLEKIRAEKEQLIREKKIKKEKTLPPISEHEIPFEIPENWVWCRLGEIAEHNAGKTMHGSQNTGKERKCITTSNLYWGYFDLKKLKEIRIEDKELSSCTATKGDLLICEGGESGRSAIWEYEYDICFQNHVHRVRPYDGVINYFLYYIMLYLDYSGQINNYRKGMGISNLSGKALSSIIHPLPPSAEQKRIVTKLDELMKLCDNLEASIKESQQQNELLLQQVLREALEPRN
jgi:type I restriction enzyme S subunit